MGRSSLAAEVLSARLKEFLQSNETGAASTNSSQLILQQNSSIFWRVIWDSEETIGESAVIPEKLEVEPEDIFTLFFSTPVILINVSLNVSFNELDVKIRAELLKSS